MTYEEKIVDRQVGRNGDLFANSIGEMETKEERYPYVRILVSIVEQAHPEWNQAPTKDQQISMLVFRMSRGAINREEVAEIVRLRDAERGFTYIEHRPEEKKPEDAESTDEKPEDVDSVDEKPDEEASSDESPEEESADEKSEEEESNDESPEEESADEKSEEKESNDESPEEESADEKSEEEESNDESPEEEQPEGDEDKQAEDEPEEDDSEKN